MTVNHWIALQYRHNSTWVKQAGGGYLRSLTEFLRGGGSILFGPNFKRYTFLCFAALCFWKYSRSTPPPPQCASIITKQLIYVGSLQTDNPTSFTKVINSLSFSVKLEQSLSCFKICFVVLKGNVWNWYLNMKNNSFKKAFSTFLKSMIKQNFYLVNKTK